MAYRQRSKLSLFLKVIALYTPQSSNRYIEFKKGRRNVTTVAYEKIYKSSSARYFYGRVFAKLYWS